MSKGEAHYRLKVRSALGKLNKGASRSCSGKGCFTVASKCAMRYSWRLLLNWTQFGITLDAYFLEVRYAQREKDKIKNSK